MSRKSKILTIADIQTRDIFYYDPDLNERCYKFCADRDIDCLPALDDGLQPSVEERKIFLRDQKEKIFKSETIGKDRVVSGTINIFHPKMLDIFNVQPLMLVHQDDELTGVVHFADYGKSVVSIHLYELFLDYEKTLRQLLLEYKLGDVDMIAYFKKKDIEKKNPKDKNYYLYKNKIDDYNEKIGKGKRQPFELFQLRDLIALFNHKKLGKLSEPAKLRNMIMHAHELVNREDPDADDYIYNFESFKDFFNRVSKFHLDYRRVINRLAFYQESPLTS